MPTEDPRAVGSAGRLLVSRREVLQLTGSALAFAVGCEGTSSPEAVTLSEPPRETEVSPAHEAAHRRHRIAFLMGDSDPDDACTRDCTAAFLDHEYGGTSTWH